jgi:Spy/CpxP family protein refolding chaperone
MKKRTLVLASLVLLAGALMIATPAIAQRGQGMAGRAMGRGGWFGFGLTSDQQEQVQKIQDKYNDNRVNLENRLKALRVEMGDLLKADTPDFGAIEKKLTEISGVRLDLAKLRLRIHQDIRPLLNDDQKVLFDRGLGRRVGRGGRFGGQCVQPGAGWMMGGRRGSREMGPGMHHRGRACGMMLGGPQAGGQPGPFCPWMQGQEKSEEQD